MTSGYRVARYADSGAAKPGVLIGARVVAPAELMKREGTPFIYDWLGQKCFEDAAPMGPWFTPAAYIADPNDMAIKLWVNGVFKQDSMPVRSCTGSPSRSLV